MKHIYRVEAHDTTEVQYVCTSPMYYVSELSIEGFRHVLDIAHEGTVAIDSVKEVTVEEVVNLLNLYID
jgi:hypothetical protein